MSPRDFLGQFNVSSDLQYTPGIMMLEDCEGSDMWYPAGTAPDYTVTFETAHCLFGTQGLSLKTRATGPAEDDYCSATRWLSYPESKLLILRGRVMLPTQVLVKYAEMYIGYFKPGVFGLCGIRWDVAGKLVRVWTTGGAWTTITGMGFGAMDNSWLDFEIGMDMKANEYKYVMFNGIRAVPTVLPVTGENPSDYRVVYIELQIFAAAAQQTEVVFDSIYVGSYLNV